MTCRLTIAFSDSRRIIVEGETASIVANSSLVRPFRSRRKIREGLHPEKEALRNNASWPLSNAA
jgi:hypothetical protein